MTIDSINTILFFLYGVFILSVSKVNSQLFAEEITDGTYLSSNVTVIHSCTLQNVICSQIAIQHTHRSKFQFERPMCTECTNVKKIPGKNQKSVLPILIEDELICSPNYWNPDPIHIHQARLHLFEISKNYIGQSSTLKYSEIRNFAIKKMKYNLRVPPPYSRQNCGQFRNKCNSFYHTLMFLRFSKWHSPVIQVPVHLAPGIFPIHHKMGLYLNIPEKSSNHYFNKFMKMKRNTFSMSVWIYLSSPCSSNFCNILSFFDGHEEGFRSPVILLTSSNHIHFQVKYESPNPESAFKTHFTVPLRSWYQLVFSINLFKWSLSIFSSNGSLVGSTDVKKFSGKILLNIKRDFGIIGGSQVYGGFQGFIYDLFLYPGIFDEHERIHKSRKFVTSTNRVSHDHRFQECSILSYELQYYLTLIQNKLSGHNMKFSCQKYSFSRRNYDENHCYLRINDLKRPRIYKYLKRLIAADLRTQKILKRLKNISLENYFRGDSSTFNDVLASLQEYFSLKVMDKIHKKGIKVSTIMATYLKDASCLGDGDATYILAACYFYGIGAVKINSKKALDLLLINAEDQEHRLSLLALGNIHNLQLIPGLAQLSSVFYKTVADFTPIDVDKMSKDDMYNDNIRLTNEADLKEHTEEDGDLFQWIKHQASSGIPWAKQRISRMLYWGRNGIQRNLEMAMHFFRMAAEAPEAEPGDHFDYGFMLIKAPKEEEDFNKGKAELEIASEKDPRALTVLGWLAETKEKNISKAYDYYYKAYKLGNAEATFNLGIFHHYGKPGVIEKSKQKAYHFFQEAAVRNQMNAGAMYSHYLLSGMDGYLPVNIEVGIKQDVSKM